MSRIVRAQTTLPAVAVALVILTVVTGIGLATADAAITGADRTPDERRVAAATAAQLVSPDGPITERANVLNNSKLSGFDATVLAAVTPAASEYDIAVSLDDTRITASGEPEGGQTMRRLVVVEERTVETLTPDGTRVTLPRRADNATIRLTPTDGTTVWTVRAGDRIVLHNDSGLRGTFEVALARYETTELRFQAAGTLSDGDIEIAYHAPRTRKATLAVTVDA